VRGIKRCARHKARGGADAKGKPAFIEQALKSGIDVSERVDDYRANIIKQRRPNAR